MVLIKEIELALKPQNVEVQAQEDEILADSVLELANTDFSNVDEYEDVTPGAIRKHVEADMRVAYPGKPSSRKKIFKGNFKDGKGVESVNVSDLESDSEDGEVSSEKEEGKKFGSDESLEEEESDGSVDEEVSSDADEDGSVDEDSNDFSEEEFNSDVDGSILGGDTQIQRHDVGDEKEKEPEQVVTEGIDIFSERARDVESDISKGKSIRNQLSIWEKLIECRIKLQPALLNVNKLYQPDGFKEFKSSLNTEDEATITQTYTALSDLMKGLLELQENLLSAAPEFREMKANKRKNGEIELDDSPENKRKKTGNDLLHDIHEEYKPFRNATIQKWNEKTRISSGKISKNDFSSFDLPTLKQIEEILLDRDRLLRRTRTKRSDYKVLGKSSEVPDSKATAEEEPSQEKKKKNQGEYDPEIFDDDDFYHKLLRDFIENKTSDVTDVSKRGKQWVELQKLRSKMKAKVDTRASKGRKLRFTVHNKMVNFMAPIPSFTWTEEARNELFKSLFC